MKIFGKPDGPVGEMEASRTQLRNRRDILAAKFAEAKIGCEKAQAGWQSALDGDDHKALEKAGARLLEAKELANLFESELDDYARQIAIVESELSLAQGRAAREAKAGILDQQSKAIPPLFDDFAAAAGRFANELSKIEGLFDAEAASAIVRQTAESVLGAKQSILGQMQFSAAELRREPPRALEPPKLAAGIMPRGILLGRNDPHEPPMWAGNRAFP